MLRDAGHQPAASILLLPGFPVLQQLGVQPQAGIDQERPVIDQSHLHSMRRGRQKHAHCLLRIFRYAVGAAEIIEGAMRQHAQRACACQHCVGNGVDGAIAAGHHYRAADMIGL